MSQNAEENLCNASATALKIVRQNLVLKAQNQTLEANVERLATELAAIRTQGFQTKGIDWRERLREAANTADAIIMVSTDDLLEALYAITMGEAQMALKERTFTRVKQLLALPESELNRLLNLS